VTVAMEAFASVPPEPAEDLDAEAAQIARDETATDAPRGNDRLPGQKSRRHTAVINGH